MEIGLEFHPLHHHVENRLKDNSNIEKMHPSLACCTYVLSKVDNFLIVKTWAVMLRVRPYTKASTKHTKMGVCEHHANFFS
jgi:hypothetical protein